MSFDLWFAAKNESNRPEPSDLEAWFAGRKHYGSEDISDTQALYQNEATGVYFIIEFGEVFDPADTPDTERPIDAVLLLNYLRPKFFARECAEELHEFLDEFNLEVCDPQKEETGFAGFDANCFVQSFAKHSRWAVRSMQQNHGYEPKPMASDKLDAMWRWNLSKERLEANTEEGVFIPTIFIFEVEGVLSTGIVWSDGIPTVIPPCDSIYLCWDELSSKKIFGVNVGIKKPDQLYDRSALQKIFTQFYDRRSDDCLWPLSFTQPAELESALLNFNEVGSNPTMLAADAVIDSDFVDS